MPLQDAAEDRLNSQELLTATGAIVLESLVSAIREKNVSGEALSLLKLEKVKLQDMSNTFFTTIRADDRAKNLAEKQRQITEVEKIHKENLVVLLKAFQGADNFRKERNGTIVDGKENATALDSAMKAVTQAEEGLAAILPRESELDSAIQDNINEVALLKNDLEKVRKLNLERSKIVIRLRIVQQQKTVLEDIVKTKSGDLETLLAKAAADETENLLVEDFKRIADTDSTKLTARMQLEKQVRRNVDANQKNKQCTKQNEQVSDRGKGSYPEKGSN